MSGEYDIKTDLTVLPVQHGRCKVPIEYKDEIEKELGEMVQQGIIAKQTEPTLCLDPKDLNKAII